METKQYVIPDIHGCSRTLAALLEKIELSKEDELYFLGDYIDRGPDSKGVVDFIMNLQQAGYKVFPLKGNHEETLLASVREEQQAGKGTDFSQDTIYGEKYLRYFEKLPLFIELEHHFLVHAGFDFDQDSIFTNEEAMLWERGWGHNYDSAKAKHKTIVHGHTPTRFADIQAAVQHKEEVIPLDNGCVYELYPGLGKLLCLELNSYQLVWQDYIDVYPDE